MECSFTLNDCNGIFQAEIFGITKGAKWASALPASSYRV